MVVNNQLIDIYYKKIIHNNILIVLLQYYISYL